ncbi:MAG: TetR family transcriptional regulator [Hyphomonadaceae bacterium]|nr:TetR family transcriptional regulator [Hyphomonadaceae bacterium]
MSDNNPSFALDRRALRTRDRLASALIALGERNVDIDALDVAAIAASAGVSRSTFYHHFSSKSDFMVRSFVGMLVAIERAVAQRFPKRTSVLPASAIFAHIAGAPGLVRTIVQSSFFDAQMNAAELTLRQIAEVNLARLHPTWDKDRRTETSVYIAGGFVGLLRWWMQSGMRRPPERMQRAFDQLTRHVA